MPGTFHQAPTSSEMSKGRRFERDGQSTGNDRSAFSLPMPRPSAFLRPVVGLRIDLVPLLVPLCTGIWYGLVRFCATGMGTENPYKH
jgi:hypothetical protein